VVSRDSLNYHHSKNGLFSNGKFGGNLASNTGNLIKNNSLLTKQNPSFLIKNESIVCPKSKLNLIQQKGRNSFNLSCFRNLKGLPFVFNSSVNKNNGDSHDALLGENNLNLKNFNNFYKYRRVVAPVKFIKTRSRNKTYNKLKRHKSVLNLMSRQTLKNLESMEGGVLVEEETLAKFTDYANTEKKLKKSQMKNIKRKKISISKKRNTKKFQKIIKLDKKKVDLNMKSKVLIFNKIRISQKFKDEMEKTKTKKNEKNKTKII
jgi:hypothetical protein